MKNLIAYYSFTENNKKLAEFLGKKLDCDLVRIETAGRRNGFSILLDLLFNRRPEIKPVRYYLRDYDHVIFIAPIWAGKVAMPLMSFLAEQKANITRYSFLTICGGKPGQKEKIHKELSATVGKPPVNTVELWINSLLTTEKKETIKSTTGYRIEPDDFEVFAKDLEAFLHEAEPVGAR